MSACLALLTEQVEIQRPKLIIVLGKHVPRLIAKASHQLRCWSNFVSFKTIDQNNVAVILGANLLNSTHRFSTVCLVHPCYRQLNVRHRHWNGFRGDEAEVNLTQHALRRRSNLCQQTRLFKFFSGWQLRRSSNDCSGHIPACRAQRTETASSQEKSDRIS